MLCPRLKINIKTTNHLLTILLVILLLVLYLTCFLYNATRKNIQKSVPGVSTIENTITGYKIRKTVYKLHGKTVVRAL